MARLGRNPDRQLRQQVVELRAQGLSWQDVGNRLGISRQCAHELFQRAGEDVRALGPQCRECGAELAPRRYPAKYDVPILCMACLLAKPETSLGDRLKTFRITARMTQGEVARKAGITRNLVGYYEQDKVLPEWASLQRLIGLFGLRLVDIHNELADLQTATQAQKRRRS